MNTILKKKAVFKSIILSFVTILTLSMILPSFSTKADTSSVNLPNNNLPYEGASLTDFMLLQENLAENPNFSSELEDARNVLQSQIVHEDGIVTYGVAGGSLKAIKTFK